MIKSPVPIEHIEHRIYLIRGYRMMLSTDLAKLYGVEPRALVQSVKRNIERFPKDFMFQVNRSEFKNLKSQIVISKWGGLRRATPYAFTEQGVAMLSSVLHSKRAIHVNIEIMRTFVKLRKMVSAHKQLAGKLEQLERHVRTHDTQILSIFDAIQELMTPEEKQKIKIGFRSPE